MRSRTALTLSSLPPSSASAAGAGRKRPAWLIPMRRSPRFRGYFRVPTGPEYSGHVTGFGNAAGSRSRHAIVSDLDRGSVATAINGRGVIAGLDLVGGYVFLPKHAD